MIRRFLVLSISLVCCLALSSCGGEEADGDAAEGSSGIPKYATTNDERGAQNFARYWIDTLNEATTSGSTRKLKTLQKKSCEVCTDFARTLDRIYARGGHVETRGFVVQKIANEANIPAPGAGVSVVLRSTPQKVYASKNAKPSVRTGGDLRMRLIMIRAGDHWLMDRIDIG